MSSECDGGLMALQKRLSDIGIALSAEKDIDRLLEMILEEAVDFTSCDAGTLYLMEDSQLHFKIMINRSMNLHNGGTSGNEINLPPVAMNRENISAYAAITGETVNIHDVYEAEGFNFTGPKKYDASTGYRSKSMIVVPMQNQDSEIIGVLQLLNSIDEKSGNLVPFSEQSVTITQSFASQAAVVLTNRALIDSMEHLFDAFVKVMATAIDERSEYTGGHIQRVAEVSELFAEVINETKDGKFASKFFDDTQKKELKTAGWMHDIGKVTTPLHIMNKPTKLATIYDRAEAIKERFYLIRCIKERDLAAVRCNLSDADLKDADEELAAEIAIIDDAIAFIVDVNDGGPFMDDENCAKINEIAGRTFEYLGQTRNYLTEDEVENLLIKKGTLLDEEREIIQNHAAVSIKMLSQIPFTKKLANIPEFAGGHHECIDGSGYPNGIKGDALSTEARMLAIVDIYDALIASDRPYKKEMPLEKAYGILRFMAKDNKLDSDLLELFISANVHERYAEQVKNNS